MSKLLAKAAKYAVNVTGAGVLSQTPERIDNFELSLIGADSDAGLRIDGLNIKRIEEYAEDMADSPNTFGGFPPIVLVSDAATSTFWVARGNHRIAAAEQAGLACFPALVYTGTKRDAHILALGDNATHGLRRTRADMQNELRMVLTDPELGLWSDGAIAKIVKCSRKTVQTAREGLVAAGAITDDGTRKYIDKHGNEQTMTVAKTQEANTRIMLSDEEVEGIVRTELARRVTSGRLKDKIAWLVGHRARGYYSGIDGRHTTTDEQVCRVADAVRAEFEAERDALAARNEDIARRARAMPSFVPAEPPVTGAEDDESTDTPDEAPSVPEPAQPPVNGNDELAAKVAIAKAKAAELAEFKRLAELLELAVPLVEDLEKVAPKKLNEIGEVAVLVGWMLDIAVLARQVATIR